MFYYLSGTLAHKGENFVVIDAGGVGYKVYTSLRGVAQMPEIGSQIKMYTYCYIREDAFDIYGFESSADIDMFCLLIGVSGVGPKAALAILSVMGGGDIAIAIATGNAKAFTQAQGVGAKVAQRIILELAGKIKNEDLISPAGTGGAVISAPSVGSEALEALLSLGYSQAEAKSALAGIDPALDLELILKQALKNLMK